MRWNREVYEGCLDEMNPQLVEIKKTEAHLLQTKDQKGNEKVLADNGVKAAVSYRAAIEALYSK